jgi:hypothetical protein
MFGKFLKLAGVFVVTSALLMGSQKALAAEVRGTGPEAAFTVPMGAVSIPAGGELWFAFSYAGDGSQILVDVGGNPHLTTFAVWTPANVQTRSLNQSVTPVGAGGVNSYTRNADQIWNGSFKTKGTYYVVVDQSALAPGSFQLTVTGNGVYGAGQPMPSLTSSTAPAPAVNPAATPLAAASSAAMAAPAATMVASGASPEDAITGARGWVTTSPGTVTWYAFQYYGDNSNNPQVMIHMFVYPSAAATYAVWTPANLQTMASGQSVTPVGVGSASPNNSNDLVWSGSFNTAGTYYVVVTHSGPGGYNLHITESGATFQH